jgi:hypothetical protein
MIWYAWVMVGLYALAALVTVAIVDQPRKPITRDVAVLTLVTNSLYIWAIVNLATN